MRKAGVQFDGTAGVVTVGNPILDSARALGSAALATVEQAQAAQQRLTSARKAQEALYAAGLLRRRRAEAGDGEGAREAAHRCRLIVLVLRSAEWNGVDARDRARPAFSTWGGADDARPGPGRSGHWRAGPGRRAARRVTRVAGHDGAVAELRGGLLDHPPVGPRCRFVTSVARVT